MTTGLIPTTLQNVVHYY